MVTGHTRAPADLQLEKKPTVSLDKSMGAGWCGEGKKSLAHADNRTPIPPSFRQSLIFYNALKQ
jgi:hypothetical protein